MRAGRRLARDRLARKKRRTAWRRAVIAGVCAVALGTTYALILPGVTLEETPGGGAYRLEDDCRPLAEPAAGEETSPAPETAPPEEAIAPIELPPTATAAPEPEAAPAEEAAETTEPPPTELETAPSEETAETTEPPPTEGEASPEAAETPPVEASEPVEAPAVEAFSEEMALLAAQEMVLEEDIALAAEETPLIAKACEQVGDTLNYTLTINPDAQDLAAGQLRVVDTLTYYVTYSSSVSARLAHGSVKAYRLYPNGDEIPLDTSAYRYVYEEICEESGFVVRRKYYTDTLSIDIPDETAVRIRYQYALYGTAGMDWNMREFTNTAKLQDGGTQEYLPDASAQVSQGTVKATGQTTDPDTAVVIHTVDSADHDVDVPGETFTLWKYSGGGYVSQGDFVTDDQGCCTLTDLAHYTAYHITKGAAPPGYVSDDVPVYFYINCGFSHSQALPSDTSGFQVISPQGHIDLTYTRDHARVTVKANWRDPEGNPGVPSQDTLEFELLQTALAADGTAVGEAVSIGRFQLTADAWAWSSETLSGFLPTKGEKDGQSVQYSYAIREDLSVPGYYITYGTSLDAIIVTVRQTYILPSTGGGGPGGYLAAGLALMVGAGYLLYRQRKRKGGLDPP